MSFLDSLYDDAALLAAVALDASDPASWLTGEARNTAALAEWQNAQREGRAPDPKRVEASAKNGLKTIAKAGVATVEQAAEKTKAAASFLGTWGPWLLGGAAVVVLAVVALPYVGGAKAVLS